jgi:hypothetical protein
MAGAGMVAMGMGDHGALDGLPRVDVEIARLAVEAAGRGLDQHRGETLRRYCGFTIIALKRRCACGTMSTRDNAIVL